MYDFPLLHWDTESSSSCEEVSGLASCIWGLLRHKVLSHDSTESKENKLILPNLNELETNSSPFKFLNAWMHEPRGKDMYINFISEVTICRS